MTAFVYTSGLPNPPDNPSNDVSNMQQNTNSINGIIAVDHVGFNTTGPAGTGGGQHLQVTFNGNNVPTVPTTNPILFANLVGSLGQLFFYSGSATNTSAQYANGSNGSTFLFGGNILKWGQFTMSAGTQTITYAGLTPPLTPFPNNTWAPFLVPFNSAAGSSNWFINTFNVNGFTVTSTPGAAFIFLAVGY
jgi:hypothetical protein